ncbi:hypothetical protein KKC94_03035 [Patescibacteria group bacterium]|nr:hypothetical protein [Patescibacteria group bacterium]
MPESRPENQIDIDIFYATVSNVAAFVKHAKSQEKVNEDLLQVYLNLLVQLFKDERFQVIQVYNELDAIYRDLQDLKKRKIAGRKGEFAIALEYIAEILTQRTVMAPNPFSGDVSSNIAGLQVRMHGATADVIASRSRSMRELFPNRPETHHLPNPPSDDRHAWIAHWGEGESREVAWFGSDGRPWVVRDGVWVKGEDIPGFLKSGRYIEEAATFVAPAAGSARLAGHEDEVGEGVKRTFRALDIIDEKIRQVLNGGPFDAIQISAQVRLLEKYSLEGNFDPRAAMSRLIEIRRGIAAISKVNVRYYRVLLNEILIINALIAETGIDLEGVFVTEEMKECRKEEARITTNIAIPLVYLDEEETYEDVEAINRIISCADILRSNICYIDETQIANLKRYYNSGELRPSVDKAPSELRERYTEAIRYIERLMDGKCYLPVVQRNRKLALPLELLNWLGEWMTKKR